MRQGGDEWETYVIFSRQMGSGRLGWNDLRKCGEYACALWASYSSLLSTPDLRPRPEYAAPLELEC